VRIRFLGTGDSAGWPHPFCDCDSCQAVRGTADVRGNTCVLVDDTLLVDLGPDGVRSAARFGIPLSGVRHILLSHAHADHLHPEVFYWRQWAGPRDPVDLVGPPTALQRCAPYHATDSAVRPTPAVPGERLQVGDYAVLPVQATHDADAVLYDITGPDGRTLFYGTDTGLLCEETLAAMTGRAFDVVLLEATFGLERARPSEHLDLVTLASTIEDLRGRGAITEQTMVIAVHLSHRNPPPARLTNELARIGAVVRRDGDVVEVGSSQRSPQWTDQAELDVGSLAARVDETDEQSAQVLQDRRRAAHPQLAGDGDLDRLGRWIASVQGKSTPADFERARAIVVVADHVVAEGVSGSLRSGAQQAADLDAGTDPRCAVAAISGVGIRCEYARAAVGDADVRAALARGLAIADDEVDRGTDLIIATNVGTGATASAAAVVGTLLGLEPTAVTGRGGGIDDAGWMRKVVLVRTLMRRARPSIADPVQLLVHTDAGDIAMIAGVLVGAAARRTPVLLDGVVTIAAALLARELAPEGPGWWLPAHRPADPLADRALGALALEPVVALDLGTAVGALAAVPLLRAAVVGTRAP